MEEESAVPTSADVFVVAHRPTWYSGDVQLRFNFRLYPTAGQRGALAQAFGCARVVFNDTLHARREAWGDGERRLSDAEVSKRLTESKRAPERAWLNDVSSVVLQQAAADANAAYRNWLSSLSGRRKGPKVGAPRFRSRRDHRQAIRFTRNARFSVTSGGRLRLPKVGDVEVRWSRDLPSVPSSVCVVMDAAGRYFASFVVDTGDIAPLSPVDAEVGIDLGLTSFAVLSNGKVIENPRYLRKAERRLKRAQQALSRKEKGSRNRAEARVKVARAHAHVSDARRDFAHKLSTTIIRENQAVYVEDLAVKGLARTRLAKSVHDAGWGMFLTLLEEKAARYGRTFAKVDRWFPSSQLCSACGVKDGPKPLSVREWTCPECGTHHDRDLNAARNILLEGRKTAAGRAASACGGDGRPGLGQAVPDEAGTHRSAA
jgi:IS605 OrfB family transposase